MGWNHDYRGMLRLREQQFLLLMPIFRRLVMRFLVISAAAILGIAWGGLVPAKAAPMSLSTIDSRKNPQVTAVEKIGYWRRQYRRAYRWGYPVPYAYYPPAYGYYAPPPAYGYYAPYPYYRPYYAPY